MIDESQETVETPYEVVPISEILQPYLIIRLKAQLKLNTESTSEAIKEEFAEQLKKASSGVYTFYFKQCGAYIKSNEEEGVTGFVSEKRVENLAGKWEDGRKKKKTAVATELVCLYLIL